jgi:SAM-dependent methyltransferase
MVDAGESAVARHDRMVREEKAQADAVASLLPAQDIWQGRAGNFRPSAAADDDALIAALAALAGAGGSAIDVGAGGGRVALPLAAFCRLVVTVEPSAAMRAVLEEEIARRGVANLRVVAATWDEAAVEPAELVFASHVTYGVQAIEPFLRKLDSVATRHAALIAFDDPPQALIAPFWQAVYGEPRLRLPCAPELLDVLRELGARPEVITLPTTPPQAIGRADEALPELRRRLYVAPNTDAETRLQQAISTLAVERDGLLWPRNARPRARRLIHWPAGSFASMRTGTAPD